LGRRAGEAGEPIDYLTFVPDGEPTLDVNLMHTIELLQPLGVKIGVITNSSLIWRKDVRRALGKADWVSVKVDAVIEETWHAVNRPHKKLQLDPILKGIEEFEKNHSGTLVTETMLVRDVNLGEDDLIAVAEFLERIEPSKSYLSIPIRPPAEAWVLPPEEEDVARAYQIISGKVATEYLIGYEGNTFAFTGDPREDLLSITAVHPMREDAVEDFLHRADAEWTVVRGLIDQNLLVETEFDRKKFYLRKFPRRKKHA
jgi:wyosine [tRNA(Phe)-imidazoG37] synthetase (radical SAM superfamily)